MLNRCRLADGLHDSGVYEEALELYQGVLLQDDEPKGALHGAGLCQLEQGDHEAAASLAALAERDASYRDYEPWQ